MHAPKPTIKTADLKSDMPSVREALQRLDREIAAARKENSRLLKIVHGYGSKGVEATWKLLRERPELKDDPHLGRRNQGITIVVL